MGKIIDRGKLPRLIGTLREQGKAIVTMNGSFDVLHAGHVRCLQEAKEQGDILLVPLNSDKSIQSYKGRGRPIIPQKDRAEMLTALACVDYIVLFDDINPKSILAEIRPDVHCNGADWGPGCIERETVEQGGGRLHILKWSPGHSTTQIFDSIRSAEKSPAAVFVSKDISGEGAARESILRRLTDKGFEIVPFGEDPLLPAIEAARDSMGLALSSSWVVSDQMSHIITGRELNVKTLLVGSLPEGPVMPHCEAEDFENAAAIILDPIRFEQGHSRG